MNSLFSHKYFNRLFIVASHAMSQFLPSVGNLLISIIVIRLLVPEWWGEIAILQLYMYIAVQVCSWGNKDQLMRDFSIQPSAIKWLWAASFNNRLFLLLFAFAGTFFITTDGIVQLNLCVWILLRYIQQAFEAPVLFRRHFLVSIFSDIVYIAVSLALLYFFKTNITFIEVLIYMTLGQLAKTLVLISYFKSYFTPISSKPNLLILKKGFPFMMLGLSGVMLQKTDMITVAYFLTKYEVAQYQVFCSFLLFMQAFPGLITAPYAKNIYRISSSSYTKIQISFILIGLTVTSIFIAITYFSMVWIYAFNFSWILYLLGFLYGSLTYFYAIRIYILYKNNGQNIVMWISAAGIVLNFMVCWILIPKFTIVGAVLGNVLTQLFLTIAYQSINRKLE